MKVRSTVRPDARVIDEHSVWINDDIREIETDELTEYEYEQVRYGKDEYMMMLESRLLDTQLALCDVYELMGGGENG